MDDLIVVKFKNTFDLVVSLLLVITCICFIIIIIIQSLFLFSKMAMFLCERRVK